MAPSAVTDFLPTITLTSKSIQPNDDIKHVHGKENLAPLAALSYGGNVLPGIPKFESLAEQRQWQLEHMAAAFRHWSREGYVEGISGHISVRDPEHTDCFWTNPFGTHFGMLKASDMVMVNLDGKLVGGNIHKPLNAAGFLIHAAIHKARPDVHAICHAHTVYGKAWSVFGRELEILTQDACKFYKAHSVYNAYGGIVLAAEEGNQIAQALGPNKACILRNHGLLTVGSTVDEAAFLFTSMEHACHGQLLCEMAAAGSTGSGGSGEGLKKVLISDEEAAFNCVNDSDPETLYAEFQPYYEFEEWVSKGEFKL